MQQRAVQVAQKRLEGEGSRPGFTTVGVASVLVLEPNHWRKEAIFVNDSLTIMYLAKGSEATLNAGIRLNASGGSYVLQPDSTGRIYTGPISAITSVATQNLCWTEDW